MRKTSVALILAAALSGSFGIGCAGQRPVVTDSTLGSVIVYRNGVAYFERYADPGQKELKLRVPAERVDDFLKSLSIIDMERKEPLPVSYPTVESFDGYVELTIALPKSSGRLKITYVTESPAWKPSYRIVLQDDKTARLQGWAVVDNASGEDWKDVRVGVGSTSALSFRYDLHSIRLVEREMLSTGEQLAHAPPTGGSPYAVATRKVRVIGSLDSSALSQLQGQQERTVAEYDSDDVADAPRAGLATGTTTAANQAPMKEEAKRIAGLKRRSKGDDGKKSGKNFRGPAAGGKAVYDGRYLENLRNEAGEHRIRIEGFAQSGDGDPQQAALSRANAMRDQLIQSGVPEANIDVVATGRFNNKEAVRVLATDEEVGGQGHEGQAIAARDTQPVGHAHFLSAEAMDIEKEHSAMVSMLNQLTDARRVYFYDPVSQRGSKTYAFNAVRIHNPSDYTLDAGPFTIYAKGQFLGEGLSEAILPKSTAFIPYALDRSIVGDPEIDSREEIDKLLTIQRGVVTTETRRIRRTKLTLSNRGQSDAEVYVRHMVAKGFQLSEASEKATAEVKKLGGAHLFRVDVPKGEAVELVVEEWTPLMKTVDIRTDVGVREVGMFLKKRQIEPKLMESLQAIVKSHTDASNLQQRIELLDEQIGVFRTRIDEINVQLVTLKKVAQAAKLRQHLQDKMLEISETLQKSTMELTELKGELMTLRIVLQDRLAELTLEKKPDPDKVAIK